MTNNTDLLFPEPAAAFTRSLRRTEPVVVWLQQSTRPEAAAARRRVNDWYATFPDRDGLVAARLQSKIDEDFFSALDELYVHQLLHRVEPDVRYEEGGIGEPDFRVYRAGMQVLVVEVVSLFQRKEWTKEERRHGELSDYLDAELWSDV